MSVHTTSVGLAAHPHRIRMAAALAAVAAICGTARAQWSLTRVPTPVDLARAQDRSADGGTRVDSPRDGEGRPYPRLVGPDSIRLLPLLPTGRYGAAVALSAGGDAVAGWSHSLTGIHAVRWSVEGGNVRLRNLGSIPGASVMLPAGISDRGDTIAGFATFLSPVYQPWRWTPARGLEALATDSPSAIATVVSADGSLIAGESFDNVWSPSRATFWQSDNRPVDLFTALEGAGVDVYGWRFTTVTSVSADGRTLSGRGFFENAESAWLVTIPSPAASLLLLGGWCVARRRR